MANKEEDKYMVKFHERRFLNKKNGRAYSIAKVDKQVEPSKDKYGGTKHMYWSDLVSVYLEVGDCSDDACLEFSFSFGNKKNAKKQIKKLDQFIETCLKMRKAMTKDNKKLRKKYRKFKKAEAKRVAKAQKK